MLYFQPSITKLVCERSVHVRVRSRLGIEIFLDQDLDSGTDSDSHGRGHVCPMSVRKGWDKIDFLHGNNETCNRQSWNDIKCNQENRSSK